MDNLRSSPVDRLAEKRRACHAGRYWIQPKQAQLPAARPFDTSGRPLQLYPSTERQWPFSRNGQRSSAPRHKYSRSVICTTKTIRSASPDCTSRKL